MTLLFIVLTSTIIPFIALPQPIYSGLPIKVAPIFQNNTIIEKPVQTDAIPVAIYSTEPISDTFQPIVISTKTIILIVYLTGAFISLLILVFRISSVLLLFRKSRKTVLNGIHIMIVNDEIPAFSFKRHILISQQDYETNSEAILIHELSHINQGHFYDLFLLEIVKIVYWFNPLVYRIDSDMKEIHEFLADEHTLNSGIDATKYQLLIIQKCVGHKQFALANSFNHCQIKNRITMINKSKTSKAWCWKVATFLPLLALLLMAFGKRGEIVTPNINLPLSVVAPSEPVQQQYEQFKQKIEIKKDGNYIDKKLCSLQEIADKGQEWYKRRYPDNDFIYLLIDESLPLSRVDEVRAALTHNYWVVQTTVNSDDFVYFAGDVSAMAKFSQGKFSDWISSQLENFPEIRTYGKETTETFPAKDGKPAVKAKVRRVTLSFSFIIGKDGKVRDAHIVKGSGYPEVDAAYERILLQIPDWIPAKRAGSNVSVYEYNTGGFSTATTLE